MGDVIQFDRKKKKKSNVVKGSFVPLVKQEKKPDADDFVALVGYNKKQQEKIEKLRSDKNKSVLRSYRIKTKT